MSTSQSEAFPPSAAPAPTLLERAQGLNRGQVLKEIAGPVFTELLQPVYDPVIHEGEIENLEPQLWKDPKLNGMFLQGLGDGLTSLLEGRLEAQLAVQGDSYQQLRTLMAKRPDLFYHVSRKAVCMEGIVTGIMVPLQLGVNIYRLESGDTFTEGSKVANGPLPYHQLAATMRRPVFDRMLHSLTKGANGFLANPSFNSGQGCVSDNFFGFLRILRRSGKPVGALRIWDAYKMENGEVAGFSDQYHVSAEFMRRTIRREWEEEQPAFEGAHTVLPSTGCPVRHRFQEDVAGPPQESLITAANGFLIAALEAIGQKSERYKMAHFAANTASLDRLVEGPAE